MLPLYLMALVLTTGADYQAATLGAGTYTGHVLVNHRDCSLTGAGIDRTTIALDGTYDTAFRATADRGSFTVSNLTIDVGGRQDVAAVFEVLTGIIGTIRATSVRVIGLPRNGLDGNARAVVYNRGIFEGNSIEVDGDSAGILHFTGATSTTIRGWTQRGGQYVFHNSGSGVGIDLEGINARHDYFAHPRFEEVTATGYGATYVDVDEHISDDRTVGDAVRHLALVLEYDAEHTLRSPLVQLRDRIEVDGVAWTQVLSGGPGAWLLDSWRAWGSWRPTSQPSGTARVLRASYGYLMGWDSTRLSLQLAGIQPPSPRWRYWDGSTAPTPTLSPGSRVDIIRHGKVNRDTDSGSIHCNEDSVNARVVGCSIFGGGSDMITMRGSGSVVERSYVSTGYDMGFTIDGTDGRVTVRRCHADRAGRAGFHCSGGPSDLYSCLATNNGTINDGSGDFGVTCTEACEGSTLQVRGSGNLDGLLGGHITEVSPGGFERPRRVPVTWWRRWR